MNMRRLMVAPRQFGSAHGYTWESVETPDTVPEPHHDYCSLYQDNYSIRLWEPGRMSLSTPGVYSDGDSFQEAPQLPMRVEVHGIKGAAYIRMDGSPDGVGRWRDTTTGLLLVPQPTPQQTYAALSGIPNDQGGNGVNVDPPTLGQADYNQAAHLPMFVALYRGTYKQIDTTDGWEIDSGPTDDSAVILGLDITNPQVLESSRLDWWDMDMVRLPTYGDTDYTYFVKNGLDGGDSIQRKLRYPGKGSFHKYSMDLKANKRLGPDQVLWLHFMTGVVRMPVLRSPGTGEPYLDCCLYEGHKFSVSVQASMLVTPRVSV